MVAIVFSAARGSLRSAYTQTRDLSLDDFLSATPAPGFGGVWFLFFLSVRRREYTKLSNLQSNTALVDTVRGSIPFLFLLLCVRVSARVFVRVREWPYCVLLTLELTQKHEYYNFRNAQLRWGQLL